MKGKLELLVKVTKKDMLCMGDYAADVLDIYLTKVYNILHKQGDYLILIVMAIR